MNIKFEKQSKTGFNNYGHYQFGSNCCLACKVDRPLGEEGDYCEQCLNPCNFREAREHNKNIFKTLQDNQS